MARVLTAVLVLAMIAHLIRPFGLPGLRHRGDAWKLAVLALLLIVAAVAIRPE